MKYEVLGEISDYDFIIARFLPHTSYILLLLFNIILAIQ